MATDVSLGGFLLTQEEWGALDEDERLMLLGAVVDARTPRPQGLGQESAVPEAYCDSYYESYEIIVEEKLAS